MRINKILIFCVLFTACFNSQARTEEIFSPHAYYTRGLSSWYSETDPGILQTTANMEIFDDSQLTCAIWDLPFNTYLKATNTLNGKSVIVRVNDRGPARRLVRQGRVIDLTKEAFSRIADTRKGLINIEVSIIR